MARPRYSFARVMRWNWQPQFSGWLRTRNFGQNWDTTRVRPPWRGTPGDKMPEGSWNPVKASPKHACRLPGAVQYRTALMHPRPNSSSPRCLKQFPTEGAAAQRTRCETLNH